MISAQPQRQIQERLIADLMVFPNTAWDNIVQQASSDPNILEYQENIKLLGNILKTNVAACTSVGSFFY